MSKLLIPNTTQVPNVILDCVMRDLQPGAFKVLVAICRFTYGWQKQSDQISLKQLQEITGMTRWSVVRSLKQLHHLVNVVPGTANRASRYSLKLEISTGELVTKSDQSHKVTSHLGSHLGVTIQTNSKPKKNIASTPKKAPRLRVSDPRIKEFFSFWADQYRPRFASGYVFSGNKEGASVKRALATHDLPRLKELALVFFNSRERWITETGGYTIGVFVSQINKLVSTSRASAAPQRELPA